MRSHLETHPPQRRADKAPSHHITTHMNIQKYEKKEKEKKKIQKMKRYRLISCHRDSFMRFSPIHKKEMGDIVLEKRAFYLKDLFTLTRKPQCKIPTKTHTTF